MWWALGHTQMGERREKGERNPHLSWCQCASVHLSLLSVLSTSLSCGEPKDITAQAPIFSTHSPTFTGVACRVFSLDCWFQPLVLVSDTFCVCVCVNQSCRCSHVSLYWVCGEPGSTGAQCSTCNQPLNYSVLWIIESRHSFLGPRLRAPASQLFTIWTSDRERKATENNPKIFKLNKPAVNSMFSLHLDIFEWTKCPYP